MSSIYLGVNIDHVATLRNARGTQYPDPVHAAEIAERAGADGITIHLREDRRHITDRDVRILRETLQTRMNLEMAVTDEMVEIALHTGHYSDAKSDVDQQNELKKIAAAAAYAHDLGITVNAGHGLTYHNVAAIAAIPEIYELNIGHAIIGRAVFDGLAKAVADMKAIMVAARR